MNNILNDETEIEQYKFLLVDVLKELYDLKINNIKFEKKEYLNNIVEYNFFVWKYIIKFDDINEKEIYIKIIHPRKNKRNCILF